MSEIDISYEEIRSRLRLLRKPTSHKHPRPVVPHGSVGSRHSLSRPGSEAGDPPVSSPQDPSATHEWNSGRRQLQAPRKKNTASLSPSRGPVTHSGLNYRPQPRSSRTPEPVRDTAPDTLSDTAGSTCLTPGQSNASSRLGPPRRTRGSGGSVTPASRPQRRAHEEVDSEPTQSLPPSMPPSPTSTSSGGRVTSRREDNNGPQYLSWEELGPFSSNPDDRWVNDLMSRLGASTAWSEQFEAINDARRLARYAPRALESSGHFKRLVGLVAALADSLRSALAKNAIRCIGEFFAPFGKRMDAEINVCLPVIFRRGVDTNVFIASEAETALCEMFRTASEPKLLSVVLASLAHRRHEIRAKAVWCLAMLAQRLGLRGPGHADLRVIAEATEKALGDANADVRTYARVGAIALSAACGDEFEDLPSAAKLSAALIAGIDPAAFDAFDPDLVHQCGELSRLHPITSGHSSYARSAGIKR